MKILPVRSLLFVTLAALPVALAARAKVETFTAALSGSNEVPSVDSKASGTATVTLDGNKLTFKLEVSNLDNATMAHIHGGESGKNGGVLLPLFAGEGSPGFSGVLAQGTVTVGDEVVEAIRSGDTYVNVHTKAHPGGELRGQLKPAM